MSGCSTYAAHRYSISADDVVCLRTLEGKTINVGKFTSTEPELKQISCRAVGPIKTPDGETFAEYIREALLDELRMANVYSADAPVTLTGNLDEIDFSSTSGTWDLTLTVNSSNGKSITVTENYSFTSSWVGETACNQTAQALMPAVQNLIGKFVQHERFKELVE
jgi:hypothetical protein